MKHEFIHTKMLHYVLNYLTELEVLIFFRFIKITHFLLMTD